ncbi:unnamed protein product [Cladocopium goreaui]|uniref:DeSI-like protein n=1 Tax=Cladocopium goreaui TaxID=2562237 RepID=A0A9P1FLR6_9DINO|nr:unnamed protein product [Cladocopium goreaui]
MAPKQTKKDEQNKQPNDKKENFIMKYRLWAKSALAPYPAEDGSPLYTGDLEAEAVLWTNWKHRGTLTAVSDVKLAMLDAQGFFDLCQRFMRRSEAALKILGHRHFILAVSGPILMLVGGLIGRGGAGTKEVQMLTGTKIGIREIPDDPDNRSLNIAGPLANTCAAYMLMMKRYLDSEDALGEPEMAASCVLEYCQACEVGDEPGSETEKPPRRPRLGGDKGRPGRNSEDERRIEELQEKLPQLQALLDELRYAKQPVQRTVQQVKQAGTRLDRALVLETRLGLLENRQVREVEWTISEYSSLLENCPKGQCIMSPTFSAAGIANMQCGDPEIFAMKDEQQGYRIVQNWCQLDDLDVFLNNARQLQLPDLPPLPSEERRYEEVSLPLPPLDSADVLEAQLQNVETFLAEMPHGVAAAQQQPGASHGRRRRRPLETRRQQLHQVHQGLKKLLWQPLRQGACGSVTLQAVQVPFQAPFQGPALGALRRGSWLC